MWDEFHGQVFATHVGKGVDLPTLKRIKHDYCTTGTRILHSIQVWLDYDFEVSWEKVVFALRKIGKNADTERLQSQVTSCPEIHSLWSRPAPLNLACSSSHTTDTLPEASKDKPGLYNIVLRACLSSKSFSTQN